MEEDPISDRLRKLEDRLKAAETARAEPVSRRSGYTQSSLAWRMVTELVAGMGLGVGIGYGLDSLFGTMPLFLMLFSVLGFAAGVRTMMRTADDVRNKRSEAALLRDADATTTRSPDRDRE
jgi:ATP synthase protein I